MTSAILSGLNVLMKPLEAPACDAASSQQEALVAALRANRALLLERLRCENGLEEARKLREEVMAEAKWFCRDTGDAIWDFVQECLLLLLTLARHLSLQLALFDTNAAASAARPRTTEMAPPLPPDVLSIVQQKTLSTTLQFVVSLGLSPYLASGVGVPLGSRTAFGVMVEKLVCGDVAPTKERRLLTTTSILLQLAELSSLATAIFTRHLRDILAALCQLGHCPHRSDWAGSAAEKSLSIEERKTCREALRSLLGKVYQPIVIKELLLLQGRRKQPVPAAGDVSGTGCRAGAGVAPAWLRRLCGQLLSDRLMQPSGVLAVVRAILEGGPGGDSDWVTKCDGVARILAACPQQSVSPDSYYSQICPQILDLLHVKDKVTGLQFQRVATQVVDIMMEDKPQLAQQHLLGPLLNPLRCCVVPTSAVDELELTRCVEGMYQIWVVGNAQSRLATKALEEVLPVLFALFCFTKRNASHLRCPCQRILLCYLGRAEHAEALSAVRRLSGLAGQTPSPPPPGFHFAPGSEGGARLTPREAAAGGDDEDDALYERLSEEQWRLDCLTQLLAELKDSDLPGDFFLELLRELTSWTTEEDDEQQVQEADVPPAMTLLEAEQRLSHRDAVSGQRLALLQVLAVVCDTLPHSLLLRKTTQIVDFIASLLRRGCVGLVGSPSATAGSTVVEGQTLSMGMGLVATLLSGPRLGAEEYASMKRLLLPLEDLSQKHPDAAVRELADALRAAIATHGAYTPESVQRAARHPVKPDGRAQDSSSAGAPAQMEPLGPSTTRHRTNGAADDPAASTRTVSDWLLEACDPDVPTKALALRALTRMVQEGHPEAVRAQEKLLAIYLENLEHKDSFVYLSAIQGLAALADSFPERILRKLLEAFQRGSSSDAPERSLETRLKVGEVLMRASRAMGELAPHLGRPLVGVFLRGTGDGDAPVRASCLSNLAELCQRLNYSLGPLVQELSSRLTALIKTEREAEVRRAAVHVVGLLVRGLGDRTTEVLGDVLLDLYRALKWAARSDRDHVTVLHAQLALEELDEVMRRFLFPQQKLEKKIVVLP